MCLFTYYFSGNAFGFVASRPRWMIIPCSDCLFNKGAATHCIAVSVLCAFSVFQSLKILECHSTDNNIPILGMPKQTRTRKSKDNGLDFLNVTMISAAGWEWYFLELLRWATCHVTWLRFERILQVRVLCLFYQFLVLYMHPAVICRYCIGYEQLSFPKRSEIVFRNYDINIKFDFEFWWLSIVCLTRVWNGVSPHGWT